MAAPKHMFKGVYNPTETTQRAMTASRRLMATSHPHKRKSSISTSAAKIPIPPPLPPPPPPSLSRPNPPPAPPNKSAPGPKKPQAKKRKMSPAQAKQLEKKYDDDLDDLQWSILCASDDDSDGDQDSNNGESKSGPATSPRTPQSTNSHSDLYVPVDSKYIAEFSNSLPMLEDVESIEARKRRRQEVTDLTEQISHVCNADDVLVPSRGCSDIMLEAILNLEGNQWFIDFISTRRNDYWKLKDDDEKEKMAAKLADCIQKKHCRVFQKAIVRKPGGLPNLWVCHKVEAVQYTRDRLEKGFPDILKPWLPRVSSLMARELPIKSKIRRTSTTKQDSKVEPSRSKVLAVYHAPMVGVMNGCVKWNNGSKDNPVIKLEDLIRQKKSEESTNAVPRGEEIDSAHAATTPKESTHSELPAMDLEDDISTTSIDQLIPRVIQPSTNPNNDDSRTLLQELKEMNGEEWVPEPEAPGNEEKKESTHNLKVVETSEGIRWF